MRTIFILCLFICFAGFSQEDALANEYFKNSEFEKALIEYKKVFAKAPSNINYINQIIATYQELEQYNEAEAFIQAQMARINFPSFYVELGFNYQLKKDQVNADLNYKKALATIDANPSSVFSVARSFQSHALLNEAVLSYEKAMELKPTFNFNLQLAQLYGEQGNLENMFTKYINFAETNPIAVNTVKRYINDFITEDASNENNIILKKILLKKSQQEPNVLWNDFLSWLFIQQKEFNKAFIQEKAIFNRQPESLFKIEELALIASNENELETAKDIFQFIIETSQDKDMLLDAHYNILQIEIKQANKETFKKIDEKFKELFKTYGYFSSTLKLQIAYAHFLAFYNETSKEASEFLENALKLPLSQQEQAQVKLELGDILVLQEQFNKALIYYSQIQRNLKNSTVSQEARFKVAKTSYYKGDFKWAESQLKILKASTSQLIANDALELKLLISDNKYEDSLHTALKLYAKADLLAFQNKNEAAIALLDRILAEHKTEPIVAQTLYKQAQLFELKLEFSKAESNYQAIIDNYSDGILIDDAYFRLARIYESHLNQPEKAKGLYEKIIFNHDDSIYIVEARKRFRALRGDDVN